MKEVIKVSIDTDMADVRQVTKILTSLKSDGVIVETVSQSIPKDFRSKNLLATCGSLVGHDVTDYPLSQVWSYEEPLPEGTKMVGKTKQPWYHTGRW
ncbi:aldolase-type TIM barrel protein [Vibrio phage 1.121.O._10N.286.46.C4]|nr:aldolase-type TIM barrel protein [Vibrio phage 1.121.O._10N.286.46.C4]